jgi:hypothetical protein
MAAPDLSSLIRADLAGHAWWVIYLRYGCATAVILCAMILTQDMGATLDAAPLYGIAGALVAANLLYGIHLGRAAQRTGAPSPETAARSLALQIGADLFLLTLLLHFSGGVTNPLMALYIGPILLSGFLLTLRATYAFAAWATVLYAGMAVLESRHVIPHVPIPGLFPQMAYRNASYLVVVVIAFLLTIGLTAILSLLVSGRLREPSP